RRGAHRAQIWSGTWGTIYGAIAVTNLALVPALSQSNESDLFLGAGAAAVGVLAIAALPLKIISDQPRFEGHLLAEPDHGDPCVHLAEAERLLARDAKSEADGKGWLIHVGSALFNAGLGLVLGFGFGHWQAAAINTTIGIAVGEVMIATQP